MRKRNGKSNLTFMLGWSRRLRKRPSLLSRLSLSSLSDPSSSSSELDSDPESSTIPGGGGGGDGNKASELVVDWVTLAVVSVPWSPVLDSLLLGGGGGGGSAIVSPPDGGGGGGGGGGGMVVDRLL